MRIDIADKPATLPFSSALGRAFGLTIVFGIPLAALMLTPGLMRSRVALAPGITTAGLFAFVALTVLLIALSPLISSIIAPGPGWRPRVALRVSRALRWTLPGAWWLRAGEASLIVAASQMVGGFLAWMMPHIWRNDDNTGWVLHYPNYVMQAIPMYLIICLAAAWFGTRLRRLALDADLVDAGRPLD